MQEETKYCIEPDRPARMKYCKKCTYPEMAVNLAMSEDGICSGCIVHEEKYGIDWKEREKEFKDLLYSYRDKSKNNYDCIIPVSGGKDSHFQSWYIKNKLRLNPLLVTYYTHNYTKTGEENLRNIGNAFGIDHFVFTPSRKAIKAMNKLGFIMTGDMSWHFHCGAWTVPFQVAVLMNIPLVVYGEHGWTDLAGQFSLHDKPEFTVRYRKEHLMRGFDWTDFVGKEGLREEDLLWAKFPSDDDIERVGVRGIFMGNYVFWDGDNNAKKMGKYGFKPNPEPFERTYRTTSNVDDIHENGIKDYLKYIKFGYGRCTDHTSKDIRLGIMDRSTAIDLTRKYDHVKARKSLEYFLRMVDMTEVEFDEIADRFRDPRVWWKDSNGNWKKDNIWDEHP